MKKVFNEEHKKILVEELEKVIKDYLDYLGDNDDDEETRARMFPLLWMQNLIKTDKIDRLTISLDEEDEIYC